MDRVFPNKTGVTWSSRCWRQACCGFRFDFGKGPIVCIDNHISTKAGAVVVNMEVTAVAAAAAGAGAATGTAVVAVAGSSSSSCTAVAAGVQ